MSSEEAPMNNAEPKLDFGGENLRGTPHSDPKMKTELRKKHESESESERKIEKRREERMSSTANCTSKV